MADNVPITAGAGTDVATDDVGGVHYQKMKLVTSEADSAEGIGDTDKGTKRAIWVDPRPLLTRIQVTPTVSTTPAYSAKDAVGGVMTFANAVRVAGGSCTLDAVQLVDKGSQQKELDLILFDRTITAITDNAVFDPTDTELGYVVAVVTIGILDYRDFNDNSVAHRGGLGTPIVLNGTDLFGVLVARGSAAGLPTYTSTSDIVVTLTITQD